jgi:hypothetical protein
MEQPLGVVEGLPTSAASQTAAAFRTNRCVVELEVVIEG